ncbi:MAG: tripartite tricarboxylate transporter permease [Elusimicrobia bacterium]|nr:tripartite tricarboxylate transporter permease [Elusimicrobiota bacterium]
MNEPVLILYVVLGTVIGSLMCLIPALHIYNVAGIAIVIWAGMRELIPYYALAPFFMSLVVAFAFMNTIPMTFLGAADESAGASILPSTDMVVRGRGKDAALMTGLGTLVGAFMLLAMYPFFVYIWPYIAAATGPHLHWILGLIIVHYLMSEWPKGAGRGKNAWQKFSEAWRNCFAGIATFTLAGIFGLIYLAKPIVPAANSFQNIMPVFIGFFAIPSIIQVLISDFRPPRQYQSKYINADWKDFSYGMLPGFVGGMLAAYLPGVTAGIGAMLAGHATNHRNLERTEFLPPKEQGTLVHVATPEIYYRQERIFLIAGGVIKILYYVGAFLLLFVLTDLTPFGTGRGGLTFILKPVFIAEPGDLPVMLGTVLLSGCLSFLLLTYVASLAVRVLDKLNLKLIYIAALAMVFVIIYIMGGGWIGVGVALVTTCIGMIPVFYNCRRSHCMAVLLVPIALNMAGYGDAIVSFLGLA